MNDTAQGIVSYMIALIAGATTYVNEVSGDEWLQAGAVILLVARLLQDVPRAVASVIKYTRRIRTWLRQTKH